MMKGRVVTERPKAAVTQKPGKPLTLDARFTMLNQLRDSASKRQTGAREALLDKKRAQNSGSKPAFKQPSGRTQQGRVGKGVAKLKGQKLRGGGQRPTSPAGQLVKDKSK